MVWMNFEEEILGYTFYSFERRDMIVESTPPTEYFIVV